jgi:hypothetical protein
MSRNAVSGDVVLYAWGLAIVPNTLEAFANPDGLWWEILRIGLSTVFVLVLVAFAATRLRRD